MSAGINASRRAIIRLLGTEGVGMSEILYLLSEFAARGGAGGAVPGGCCIRMKGIELYILETHFSDFDVAVPEADMWYLVVAADDGPMDLDDLLPGKDLKFKGVFFNKCDLIDYDDELIELVQIDTCRQLYNSDVPYDNLKFIAGSARAAVYGQIEAGISALEELLKDIVANLPW